MFFENEREGVKWLAVSHASISSVRREKGGRTCMRMRYVPIARHNVHKCSVQSTAINANPSPSQVADPAVSRCPGEISIAFPMSPTILSSVASPDLREARGSEAR